MTWRGKAQRLHYHAWPKAERRAGSKLLNRESPGGSTGFISTGASDELVRQLEGGFAHLSLTYVHPMPRQMVDAFLAEHQTVIAVEEPGCFLESMLGGRVLGKLTWHLPFGELSTEDLRRAVALARSGGRLPTPEPDLFGDRRPGERICNDCPFALVYTRLAELKTPVVGDQGCTTYAAFPPLSAIDLLYDLGSSTSVAAGIGPGALAVTGDYALLHSGLAGLLDAVHNLRTLKVLVLTNGCSALTGGQPTPDLHGVVSAIVADTEAIPVWEFDVERVKRKLEEPGVWVQFVLGDCGRRRRKAP